MGLEIIPNQPINLSPPVPDDCNIGDGKEYCQLFNNGDDIYLQWKITSCGDDLSCDPFLQGGANLVTNGDFIEGLSGWNVGSGITWDGVNGKMQFAGTGGLIARYDFPAYTLLEHLSYTVSYSISGRTTGSVKAYLNLTDSGASRSTNGAFTDTITYNLASTINSPNGQFIKFVGSGGFDGKIDDVSVVVDGLSCISLVTNWNYTDFGLQHTDGNTASTDVNISVLELTGYQQIIVTITDLTVGSLYLSSAGVIVDHTDGISAMNKNGTYFFYVTEPGDFTIGLEPSSDFDGTVSELHVYELHRDFTIIGLEVGTGLLLYDATPDISYYEDRAILKTSSTNFGNTCFKLYIVDSCNNLLSGGSTQTVNDTLFNNVPAWTLTTLGATFVVTGGKLKQTSVAAVNQNYSTAFQSFLNTPPNGNYVFKITIVTSTWAAFVGDCNVTVGFTDNAMSYGNPIAVFNRPQPGTTYTIYAIGTKLSTDTKNYVIIDNVSDTTAGHVREITSISIEYASISTVTSTYGYESNCIAVDASHDCAKLVEGYKSLEGKSMGFLFPDDDGVAFRLSQRLRFIKFNPYYPSDSDDYKFTNGDRKYNYAEREKFYEGKIDYCDETTHDSVSCEKFMEKFEIDGVEYFVKPEDYKPLWGKDEGQNLAQARIDLRKVNGTIYRTL